jgi:hypothetical protein
MKYKVHLCVLVVVILFITYYWYNHRRLRTEQDSVRQIILAMFCYPTGSEMVWPTSIPALVSWSEGELDGVTAQLDMENLIYVRPATNGSKSNQPSLIYKTRDMLSVAYIVGYCDGYTLVSRDHTLHETAQKLNSINDANRGATFQDWDINLGSASMR